MCVCACVCYFTILSVAKIYNAPNDEYDNVEGIGRYVIEVLPLSISLEGLEEPRKTSVCTADISAEIRTDHLQTAI